MGRFNIGRTLFGLAAVSLAVSVTSPPVAAAANNKKLESTLEALWETVFQTPTPQNPFAGGNPSSTWEALWPRSHQPKPRAR